MSNFHAKLASMGAAPVVQSRRTIPTDCVDADSLDGAASIPSVSDVLKWDLVRRADTLVSSTQRAIELKTMIVGREFGTGADARASAFRQIAKLRAAQSWHLAIVRVLQTAQNVEREQRRAARVIPEPEEKAAARAVRLNKAHRCFVEAARRLLSPEQYELLWDEAHAEMMLEASAAADDEARAAQ